MRVPQHILYHGRAARDPQAQRGVEIQRRTGLNTMLTPAQELIVVELRTTLPLPTDDLLAVTREFINPAVSRAGLGAARAARGCRICAIWSLCGSQKSRWQCRAG